MTSDVAAAQPRGRGPGGRARRHRAGRASATLVGVTGAAGHEAACLGPALEAVRVSRRLPNRPSGPRAAGASMPIPSFAELGVSPVVCDTLSRRGFAEPVHHPEPRHRRRARRSRRARAVTDRIGQDARVRRPDGRSHRPRRPAPGRAGARPDPGAREPDRRRDPRGRPGPRAQDLRRLRRGQPAEAVARRRAGPHPRRHPGPAGGSPRAARVHAGARPDARPRRGGPDARHGLPAAGGPHRRPVPARPPDARLLGHARGCARPAGPVLHHRRDPSRGPADAGARGGDRAPLPGRRARPARRGARG